jgi:hypothetical protein
MDWTRAETFEEVRSAWARLGGRTTLHRYGRGWFSSLALLRHEQISREELDQARVVGRGLPIKDDVPDAEGVIRNGTQSDHAGRDPRS